MRHFHSSLFPQPHNFGWPCVAMYGIRYGNLILTRLQIQIMAERYCIEPESLSNVNLSIKKPWLILTYRVPDGRDLGGMERGRRGSATHSQISLAQAGKQQWRIKIYSNGLPMPHFFTTT
jgi:hypothetical protein